jgi:Family of unknown function (DUF5681)
MMTGLDPKKNAPQQSARKATPTIKKALERDYMIGKWRPPLETRWQPGRSGNPKGRPKGRRNVKSELREIVAKKIVVRDGDQERQVSLLGANVLSHGVKGAKGDVRSAGLFLNSAYRMGLVDDERAVAIESAERDNGNDSVVLITPVSKSRPSDTLFENLDLQLLAREELTELARLAEIIDLGGDITALSTADFERMKCIVDRGRGKDITQD